jgi:hypothetical protein
MSGRLDSLLEFVRKAIIEPLRQLGAMSVDLLRTLFAATYRRRRGLVVAGLLAAFAYWLYCYPPIANARRDEVLVRTNVFDSSVSAYTAGSVLVLPGIHQVIAARAQEETMQHILPFKQKQIEQRRLEAEADKVARIRTAEGTAEARRIEAKGEADSRQKLADAEAYRLDLVGKTNAGQMEREGTLITRYPLLIQKTLADKLSDKVQVIIAPTPAAGKFIGSNLIGTQASTTEENPQ